MNLSTILKTTHISDNSFNNLELLAVENILENEKKTKVKESWSKLNKNDKKLKLKEFAKKYCSEHNLTNCEETILNVYLNNLLDKKLLQKIKDVVFDKDKQVIINIPALIYNQSLRKFTLKKQEKTSTTRALNLGKTRKKLKEKIDDLEIK